MKAIVLNPGDNDRLEAIAAGRVDGFLASGQAKLRAKLLLAMAAEAEPKGYKVEETAVNLGCSESLLIRVRKNYQDGGLDAVFARKRYTYAKLTVGETAARILSMTGEPPPAGCRHWTIVNLTQAAQARGIEISTASVNRILLKAGVHLTKMPVVTHTRRDKPAPAQHLTRGEKLRLEAVLMSPDTPEWVRTRAAILHYLASGTKSLRQIAETCDCAQGMIFVVRACYRTGGIKLALEGQPRGRRRTNALDAAAPAVLALMREPAPARPDQRKPGWTVDQLAAEAAARGILPGVSRSKVERILAKAKAEAEGRTAPSFRKAPPLKARRTKAPRSAAGRAKRKKVHG
jgi:transposase